MEWIKKSVLFFPVAAAILVLKYPAVISDGVRQGISLCILTVIPSLFLFMILAEWLSKIPDHPVFLLLYPICRFLSLPKKTAPVLLMSMIGGYPAGGKILANLVKSGELDPIVASNVLIFTYQCSPAFLTAAIGTAVFQNEKIGLLIYFSQLIASLLILKVITRKKAVKSKIPLHNREIRHNLSTSNFVDSVVTAGKAVGLICFFVTVFSAVKSLLEAFLGSRIWYGFLEVSVGASMLSGLPFNRALFWSMMFTSFGGICVLLQISCFTAGTKISLQKLLLTRPVHFLLSYGLVRGVFFFFPKTASVFSTFAETEYRTASVSVTASALLVTLCFMLLISDKKCDKI